MNLGIHIHVIHVAGTRMIAQGTDALSRGCLTSGVMTGVDTLTFVPLHLCPVSRSSTLQSWVSSWLPHPESAMWLTPHDWYYKGHQATLGVWSLPPAAAKAALEQLGRVTHKRPHNMHVVLVPRLMTASWRRQLGKLCPLLFTVPSGCSFWDTSHHEPLIVGIALPMTRHRPWNLQGTPLLAGVASSLSSLRDPSDSWGRDILRQFLITTLRLDSLSPSMVRPMLHHSGQ
jgi:hypothetical protein